MSRSACCPPLADLERFLLGLLSDSDSQAIEEHVCQCATCQEQMTHVAAEDDFLRSLRRDPGSHWPAIPDTTTQPSPAPPNVPAPHLTTPAHEARPAEQAAHGASTNQTPQNATTFVLGSVTLNTTVSVAVPERLGSYQITGVLGSGGMGTVLKGFDSVLQRPVAIKVVQSRLLNLPGLSDRLIHEARAAAAVEHDNIVPVYSVEMLSGEPCIIMPLLRGQNLMQRLEAAAAPPSLDELLRIAQQSASGLAAAHARGLVHCDIKPANLWLEEPDDRIKILDFGLAVIRGVNDGTPEGISGTPGYLAPEQAQGLALDQRADIFSLGCVLYRAATGRPPFDGHWQTRALWTVLSDRPPAADTVNPQIPADFSTLISDMLSQDPAQRPPSAAIVLDSLDAIHSRIAGQAQRLIRRRWLAMMCAAAMASGSTVALWAYFGLPRSPDPVKVTLVGDKSPVEVVLRRDGHEQRLTIGGSQTISLVPGDYVVQPTTTLAGRTLVPDRFLVSEGQPQTIRVALTGEVGRHATHTRAVTGVAVIPGSSPAVILSTSLDRTLVAWDSTGVQPSRTVALPHEARCLAVSPDGRNVATAGGNRQPPVELTVNVWDTRRWLATRRPLYVHTRLITSLAYLGDTQHLASASADGICIWNLISGESHFIPDSDRSATLTMTSSADGRSLLTGTEDGQVVLWNVVSESRTTTYAADDRAIRAVAFLPDGIAAAGDDGIIRIWQGSKVEPRELAGHRDSVRAIAVSPDGQQLLSGDTQGVVRVWSVLNGATIQVIKAHPRAVQSLMFIGNGRQAVSGSADGTVRLWQLPFP